MKELRLGAHGRPPSLQNQHLSLWRNPVPLLGKSAFRGCGFRHRGGGGRGAGSGVGAWGREGSDRVREGERKAGFRLEWGAGEGTWGSVAQTLGLVVLTKIQLVNGKSWALNLPMGHGLSGSFWEQRRPLFCSCLPSQPVCAQRNSGLGRGWNEWQLPPRPNLFTCSVL